MTVVLVAAASAAGAVARYVLDAVVSNRGGGVLPLGTLSVNVAGALPAGVVAGMVAHGQWRPTAVIVVGLGFLGSFTTFSTFAYETIRLFEQGARGLALLNVAANVLVCVAAAAGGFAAAARLAA